MGYEALPRISTRNEMYKQLEAAINNISQIEEKEEEGVPFPRKYLKALIIESNSSIEKMQSLQNIEFYPTNEREIKIMQLC